jgi:hypothetical protein
MPSIDAALSPSLLLYYLCIIFLSLLPNVRKRLLDDVDQFAQCTKNVSKPEAPALDTNGVDEEVDEEVVGENEEQKDAEVSPLFTGLDVEGGEILVAVGVWAVHAVVRCIRIEEVAARLISESASILPTRLTWWYIEMCCLFVCALYLDAVESGCEYTSDPEFHVSQRLQSRVNDQLTSM